MLDLLKNLRKKTKRHYSISEEYGNDIVTPTDVYRGFGSVSAAALHDFNAVRPGQFVRPVNSHLFHVIKLKALKGSSYSVWWGASLTYLPRVEGQRLRWHRTVNSARLDLYDEPMDSFDIRTGDWPSGTQFFASSAHGPLYLAETMREMWANLEGPVLSWLGSTVDLQGVLERAASQVQRRSSGPTHDPDPQLVRAFTLRQLGQVDAALESFELFKSSPRATAREVSLLEEALRNAT